jgi:AraC-like DNA-binding protein
MDIGTAGWDQMPGGGSSIFTDADGYQAVVQDILDLLALQPRAFHARLTWADLTSLQLLRAREASARIGFMKLPANRVCVTFPTRPGSTLVYDGAAVEFGDIMLHSRGERLHQRTTAACEWASIAITPAALSAAGRTLFGQELVAPANRQVLRPRRADSRRLERLHARVCRVVERNLDRISSREVVRALEQDLISALISCLAKGKVQEDRKGSETRPDVLPAFEAMLTREPHRLLGTREICGSLGLSAATLRAKCARVLGMSPGRYQRLRRLKLVRAELMQTASASGASVEATINRHGFSGFNRFVTEYWRIYGEMPPLRQFEPADK